MRQQYQGPVEHVNQNERNGEAKLPTGGGSLPWTFQGGNAPFKSRSRPAWDWARTSWSAAKAHGGAPPPLALPAALAATRHNGWPLLMCNWYRVNRMPHWIGVSWGKKKPLCRTNCAHLSRSANPVSTSLSYNCFISSWATTTKNFRPTCKWFNEWRSKSKGLLAHFFLQNERGSRRGGRESLCKSLERKPSARWRALVLLGESPACPSMGQAHWNPSVTGRRRRFEESREARKDNGEHPVLPALFDPNRYILEVLRSKNGFHQWLKRLTGGIF